jgi:uncharacterized protein (TIGR02284 family)
MSTHQPPVPPVQPVQDATSTTRIDAVQRALTRTLDALAGYDKMLPEAEPEVAPILRKLRETHHSHAGQLGALVTALGGTPDMNGSLMGTVTKAVVSLRAMFDEIDDDALERAVEGERHVTVAFADAMAEIPEGPRREDLARMKAELDALLAEARAIAS